MSSDRKILKVVYILSPNYWGKMKLSKHHYASALADLGYVVYFISPPRLKLPFFQKETISKNLFVINYYPIFRLKSILPKALFNQLIKLQIWLLIKWIGERPDILWSFTTTLYFHLSWFKAKKTIFHPVDQLNTVEAQIIANESDIVLSCSQFILNEIQNEKVRKEYISHGLADSFIKYKFSNWKHKRDVHVGYVGNLFMRNLDRSIILKLIKLNPKTTFHFFGADQPHESNVSAWVRDESVSFIDELRKSDNVKLHGPIDPVEIPQYLDEMDMFLLCYEPDEDNVISNSHKILEYLSTGKVILSSFVESYKDSKLIEMCPKGSNEMYCERFKYCIQNLEELNAPPRQSERIQFANENGYKNKVMQVESLLGI